MEAVGLATWLALVPRPAYGQRIPVIWQPPDCRTGAAWYDGGHLIGGYMPRYDWHALTATESVLLAKGLERLHVPRPRLLAMMGVGLLPHVIGVASHAYPFNPRDWVAHLAQSSAPYADSWPGAIAAGGAYAATRCWGSP